MTKLLEYWNEYKYKLASQKITVLLLVLLALFTIVGTIYQVEFGLYAAQKKFFNSPFVFLGFIPLPSVQLILWALFINLVAALNTRIIWKKVSLGIFTLHWALLLLLFSGFYSLYFSHESFIELREGEATNRSSDYYNWELLMIQEDSGEKESWKLDSLRQGASYKSKWGLGFKVDGYFENSRIFDTPFAGRILKKLELSKEAEQNIPSLLISTDSHKKLQLYGDGLRTGTLFWEEDPYIFTLLRKKYYLPFALELIDVDRNLYPGTEIAKSYKSEVLIHEKGELKRKVKISMNKPLRYWQYTIYQASYGIDEDGGEFSVFAVVENRAGFLPYLASLIMAFAIFLHFASALLSYLKKRKLITSLLFLILCWSPSYAEDLTSPESSPSAELSSNVSTETKPSTGSSAESSNNTEINTGVPLSNKTESNTDNKLNTNTDSKLDSNPESSSKAAASNTDSKLDSNPESSSKAAASNTDSKLDSNPESSSKAASNTDSKVDSNTETNPSSDSKINPEANTKVNESIKPLEKTSNKKSKVIQISPEPHSETLFGKLASWLNNRKKTNTKLKSESLEMQGELELNAHNAPLELGLQSKQEPRIIRRNAQGLPLPQSKLSTVKIPEQGERLESNGTNSIVEAPSKTDSHPDNSLNVLVETQLQHQQNSTGLIDLSNLGKINSAKFARLSVADQGRIKPVDTFARSLLLRFSGRTNVAIEDHKLSANEWLTRLIFWPESVNAANVFLINHPEVLDAFGLEPNAGRRYSFEELQAVANKINELGVLSLQVEAKERSLVEQEILRVFDNFHTYIQVRESLRPLIASSDFRIETESRNYNLFEILQRSEEIENSITNIDPLSDASLLAPEQKEKLNLALALYAWMEGHKAYMSLFAREQQFRPLWLCDKEAGHCKWYTVWEVLADSDLRQNPKLKSQIRALADIQSAYENADQKTFDAKLNNYSIRQVNALKRNQQNSPKTNLEILYNNLNPLLISKLLYALAFIIILIASFVYAESLSPIAQSLIYSSFALHSFALISRVLILQRPPVSNLYETFVFVSWVMVILGMLIKWLKAKEHNPLIGSLLSAFAGFLLLMIASKFAAEGDTMQVVIAVLNSNFWLSTHVICISIGYAGVASAGVLAHIYLAKECFYQVRKQEPPYKSEDEIRLIMAVLAFGFCFSFIGTILGGIWADQSWGRFWGWDPKENGALLIVLWTAAIFHARLSGLISMRGTALASAVGTAVVMISWFGINILGVGLHSYGFSSGLAFSFTCYMIIETIFLSVAAYLTRK